MKFRILRHIRSNIGLLIALALLIQALYNVASIRILQLGNEGEVRLVIEGGPNFLHSALYYAREQGWFDREGASLAIEFTEASALEALMEGRADLAMVRGYTLLRELGGGDGMVDDLQVVFALYPKSPLSLFSLSELRLQGLEGKRIGFAQDPLEREELLTLLEIRGAELRGIRFLHLQDEEELVKALVSGRIDAALSSSPLAPLIKLRGVKEVNVLQLGYEGSLSPDYLIVADMSSWRGREELLRGLLRIMKEAWIDAFTTNLCIPIHSLHAYQPDISLLGEFLKLLEGREYLLRITDGGKRLGLINEANWEHFLLMGLKAGLIAEGEVEAYRRLYTNAFLIPTPIS